MTTQPGQFSPRKVCKHPDDPPGVLYVGDQGKELLTKLQVALAFDKTERTISNWMKLGYIRFVKFPDGTIRFRRRHVEEMLDRFLSRGEPGANESEAEMS